MLVAMTLSDLKRRDTRVNFFRQITLITLVPFDLDRPNSATKGVYTHRDGCISMGSATQMPQGGGAQALPNFGVPFYLSTQYTPFDAELPNLTW